VNCLKKLQLFYIYKFNTSRLKEYNNNITITIDEARKNGELVSVGDSQVLRTIRKISNSQYSEELLYMFNNQKRIIQEGKNNKENKIKIKNIQNDIDSLLHIPEYISVVVSNKNDYKKIVKQGFKVNNIKYVRLMCGAGHARKNTVIFCAEHIEKELKKILQNGMRNIEISHSKYNAYFALYSGASHIVSNPKVCVVPDCIINRTHKVDWVEELPEGDTVEEKEVLLEFNLWDGMGIISPDFAKKWAKDLGILDYIPSAFRISKSFIKGMVCVFDFHKFAELVAKKYNIINDVWGHSIEDIRNYDMIITESQFKLWKAFDSWEQYEKNCNDNEIYWGVSRVTPKIENKYSFTNYQFVQAINLDDDSIKSLCQPTVNWIQDVLGMDVMKTILFLSGNSIEDAVKDNILNINDIENDIVKALLLNNEIINDPYVKNKIYHYIQRKVNDSYIGKLLIEGNFQVMISDPYAFCEYIFGLEIKGLLSQNEYYSSYWIKKGVNKISAMRSPLTWRSEVNTLNLKSDGEVNDWMKYIKSGIVYNVHGVDTMIAADSDFDFDIVMTTNSKEFVERSYGGLPITYKKNLTLKSKFDEDLLYLSDLYSFNSEIGQVTNYSTSMYCMLAEYEEKSKEYNELINRLKICRKEQGSQIDKAKGILVKDFPITWIKEQEILDTDDEKVKDKKKFMNKLVIKKKPYFMRWLYKNYNKKYNNVNNNANTYCLVNYGCDLNQLKQKNNKSEVELKYIEEYYKSLPLNEAECIMNKLSKYMEGIKYDMSKFINNYSDFDYSIFMDNSIVINKDETYNKILRIYESFMANKHLYKTIVENDETCSDSKNKFDKEKYDNLEQMYLYYKNELIKVCSNLDQLTNIIVDICYNKHSQSSKDFAWKMCSNGMIKNIYKNNKNIISVPIKYENGTIEYLGERYSLKEVFVVENT
jgi:hypothetical protein